jgi:2'-5' RNA ligase
MQITNPVESALAVILPEVEHLVAGFRELHDPSAAAGIPAHVTVLYPFKPPAEITSGTIQALSQSFVKFPPFDVRFAEWRHLPRVLYLAPVPDDPFRRLTEAVQERFPETPPYAGQFDDVIPHLTVAQSDDADELQQITREFARAARAVLPIHTTVTEIVLLDNETGRWQIRHRFALGARPDFGNPSIK